MARLSKRELLARILDAVSLSGANALVRNDSHPFQLSIWNEYQAKVIRVFIWNITRGGPATVRSATEYRIQVTGIGSSLDLQEGIDTLLMGWSEEYRVFVAFESRRHTRFGASPSIQIDQKYLLSARESGLSFATRGNRETVACFAPDQFLHYALNLNYLHSIAEGTEDAEEEGIRLSVQMADEPSPIAWDLNHIDEPRKEIIETTRRWIRQRDFRGRILSAYHSSCAICRLQLNLVEAAHIVPVNTPGSSDATNNGLCLCVLHHKAYDKGLVGVGPDYRVLLNQAKLDLLRESGISEGERRILEHIGDTITVPNVIQDRPTRDNLIQGLLVRGWSDIE